MQKNELILYGKLSQYYKQKKFKKGLVIANKLLKNTDSPHFFKFLAWKGLFCGYLINPSKGLKTVRKALKGDCESAFIWQAFGKLHTMQGKFQNAIKCYEHGLNFEPENVGLMENLALVLVHINDLEGFAHWTGEIVRTAWSNQLPLDKNYWIWYSVALHMLGDLKGALNIFNLLSQSWTAERKETWGGYKLNELLLYHNQLIRESGDSTKALEHIMKNRDRILDVESVEEILLDLFTKNDQFEDAITVGRSLIGRNPNNRRYFNNLLSLMKLKTNLSEAGVIENLIEDLPHVSMPKALLLRYSSGKIFLQHLKGHMSAQLKKGSFSLFESIKYILGENHKKKCVMSYLRNHERYLVSSDFQVSRQPKDHIEKELISNYICSAKILDGDQQYEEALRLVKKSLDLNPLIADSYLAKAKILKHAMNPTEACKAVERAQRMDPADRYLEMKLLKYMLKANIIGQAEKMYAKLRQHDETGGDDGLSSLWYLFEKALALERVGKLEESLINCEMVEKVILDTENNASAMHSLCLKRLTLRSYENFVGSLRKLRENKYYKKTAILAVNLAIRLYDTEKNRVKPQKSNKFLGKSSSSIGKSQSTISSISAGKSSSVKFQSIQIRTGPSSIENPLIFAKKFMKALQLHHAHCIDTHLLAFEVNSRMQKPILMLRSLLEGENVQKGHPALLVSKIRCHKIMKHWANEGNLSKQQLTIQAQLGAKILWKEKSAEEIIWKLLQEEKDLTRLLEVGKALYCWDKTKKDMAIRIVTYLGQDAKNLNAAACSKILDELSKGTFGSCKEEAEKYRINCKTLFKLSTVFDIDEVKKERQDDLARFLEIRNEK